MTRLTTCFRQLCLVIVTIHINFTLTTAQPSSGKKIAVKEALDKVSELFGTKFVYERSTVRNKTTAVDVVSIKDQPVEEILKTILYPNNLLFLYVDKNHYTIVPKSSRAETAQSAASATNSSVEVLTANTPVTASNKPFTVTGKVTDDKVAPMTGATVNIKGTGIGTVTDADGNFTIRVPDKGGVLSISYIGYETVEAVVSKPATVNVSLLQQKILTQEVVVTAFGIRRDQKSLGYASQKVKGEQLSAVGNTNIQNSLQGKAAGVQVRLSSGMPGRPALINIRGSRSITGSNEPLYVIDGLPVAAGSRSIDFNPSDVESMDILKGPAAAALYGVRASNGVIVITTKSGKNASRKPVIIFESQFARDKVSFLPKLQYEYAQGNNGTFDQNNLFSYGPKISTLGTYTNLLGEQEQASSYRSMDEFYEAGSTLNNNLEIAQGGAFGNYSIGIGRTDQTGVIATTGLKRTNLKFNGLMTPYSKLKIGLSMNYADINVDDFPDEVGNTAFFRALYEAPPSYNLKGKPFASPENPYQQILFRAAQNNPYWILNNNSRNNRTSRTFGNLFLEYQIIKGLKATYRVGLDDFNTKAERYDELGTGPTGRTNPPSGGLYVLQSQKETQINSNFFLSYDKDLTQSLVLNAIAGNELFDIRRSGASVTSSNFVTGKWKNIANGTSVVSSNNNNAQRVVGFYGNVNLGYKEMLYLNLSARNDYASNLPSGNRSFLYPSAGLSFVLTEASPSLRKVFTFAKLRANYAEVGQLGQLYVNGVGYSPANPGFQFPFNGITGFLPGGTSISSTLRPENTRSVEFGTELRFLKNRISIDYTYFRSLSDGQIFGIPLPPSTGFGNQVNNAGKMLSKGHEVMLRITPIKSENFNWELNTNFSKYNNTIEELPSGLSRIELSVASGGVVRLVAEKGQTYPSFFGSAYQRDVKSGQIVLNSSNGIPLVSPIQKILGTPNPDFEFNFINSFRYKSITLSFQLDWRKGGLFYSMLQAESRTRGLSAETLGRDIKEVIPGSKGKFVNGALVVEGENDVAIFKTNPYWAALNNITEANLDVASFVRLREVSLNYELPAALINKIKIGGASIFFTGRNLFLHTNTFVDPELNMTSISGSGTSNSVGIEWYQQPQTRSLGAGFRFRF